MPDSEALYDFGRYLQTQRRSQQITLEDVSLRTKIRIVVLKQIENEDLSHLPDPTIAKGFIRAFAQAVGCDLDEAVRRYELRLAADIQANQVQDDPEERPSLFWRRILPVFILFALLVALAFYLSGRWDTAEKPLKRATPSPEPRVIETQSPQDTKKTASTEKTLQTPSQTPTIDQTPQPQTQQTQPADTEAAPQDQSASDDIQPDDNPTQTPIQDNINLSVEPTPVTGSQDSNEPISPLEEMRTLAVTAVERTWFKITIDKNTSKELILNPGEHAEFKAQETFELLIGNAAGLQIALDSQPVPIKGKRGKVVSLTLP